MTYLSKCKGCGAEMIISKDGLCFQNCVKSFTPSELAERDQRMRREGFEAGAEIMYADGDFGREYPTFEDFERERGEK